MDKGRGKTEGSAIGEEGGGREDEVGGIGGTERGREGRREGREGEKGKDMGGEKKISPPRSFLKVGAYGRRSETRKGAKSEGNPEILRPAVGYLVTLWR